MEFASQLKHSGIPLLLINQEIFGKRSYKRQPAELLTNIRNYAKTFALAKQLYIAEYGDIHVDGDTDNWDDWLANDVYGWANHHQAIMNGYTERMFSIWETFAPLWCDRMKPPQYHLFNQIPTTRRPINHYKIECFLSRYLDKKTSVQQIRSFWGALTPAQRRTFIQVRLESLPAHEVRVEIIQHI